VFSEFGFVAAKPVVVAFELIEPADCVTPCINRSESGPPGDHRTGAWRWAARSDWSAAPRDPCVGVCYRVAPVRLCRSMRAEDFVGEVGVAVGDGT
jgi:hypothetical protein